MVGVDDASVASGGRIPVVLGGDRGDARRALYEVLVALPGLQFVVLTAPARGEACPLS